MTDAANTYTPVCVTTEERNSQAKQCTSGKLATSAGADSEVQRG